MGKMSQFTAEQEQFIKQLLGATDGGTVIWTETTTAPDGTVTERKAEIAASSKETNVPQLPKPKKKKKKEQCYVCRYKVKKYQIYEDEHTGKRYPVCLGCIEEAGGGVIRITHTVPRRQSNYQYYPDGSIKFASDKENYTRTYCSDGVCTPGRTNPITGAVCVILGTEVDR